MTSAKQYKKDFEKKSSLAEKAKNAVRRAVNPTPAEMREKTAKLREANRAKEERVRALEESRQQRVKAQRLRQREAAARRPVQSTSKTGGYSPADNINRFFGAPSSSSSRYSGSSSNRVDFSKFGEINPDPFGVSRVTSKPERATSKPKKSKTKKNTSRKKTYSQQTYDPLEFFYR